MHARTWFVLAAALLVISGCAVNPATGKRQLSLIPESQEVEMGKKYDEQAVASMGRYEDAELEAYVEGLGQRLAAESERPALPWTFRVVDDPAVNAFALPGGYIYITRGILAHLDSEAELAGVVGHEIGHVTARHSVNQLSKQQLTGVLLVGAMIAKPELEQFGGLAQTGLGLMFLKFGRDDERQADDLGLRYMRREQYDAREMANVMETLERVSAESGGGRVPGWLSTHPDPGNRGQRILDQLAGAPAGGSVERDRYLAAIDGMVFGEDPRQGYFKDQRFFHPEMRFKIDFPAEWKTVNQRTQVAAVSQEQDAVVQLTLAAEGSAVEADAKFFAQEGISGSSAQSANINGLRAVTRRFAVTTTSGTLRGLSAFIEHDGKVFRTLAYTKDDRFASYETPMRASLLSFAELSDPNALDVAPSRIRIVTLPRAMSPTAMVAAYDATAPAEKLALINRVGVDEALPAGRKVKVAVGGKRP